MDIKIYLACLASYNAGDLHGEWVDATEGIDHVRAELAEMLRRSKYPNVRVTCPDCGGLGEYNADTPCLRCGIDCRVPSAEEWAIHDYEDPTGLISGMGETPNLETLCEVAEWAAGAEPSELVAVGYLVDNIGLSQADAIEKADEVNLFESEAWTEKQAAAEYARELTEDCGDIPEHLENYIDYCRMGRDMRLSGELDVIRKTDGDTGWWVITNPQDF